MKKIRGWRALFFGSGDGVRDRRLIVTHVSVYGDELMVGPMPGLSAAIRWADQFRATNPAVVIVHGHYEAYTPRQTRRIVSQRQPG